jgi:hypothetical protein
MVRAFPASPFLEEWCADVASGALMGGWRQPIPVRRPNVLAYNLVRTVMAQAAARHDVEPRSVSFKGAVQTLLAFQSVIVALGDRNPARCRAVYEQVVAAVAAHRVGDRPDRFEPRLR